MTDLPIMPEKRATTPGILLRMQTRQTLSPITIRMGKMQLVAVRLRIPGLTSSQHRERREQLLVEVAQLQAELDALAAEHCLEEAMSLTSAVRSARSAAVWRELDQGVLGLALRQYQGLGCAFGRAGSWMATAAH